jgi:hypothetical protein
MIAKRASKVGNYATGANDVPINQPTTKDEDEVSTFNDVDPETGEVMETTANEATSLIAEAFKASGVNVIANETGLEVQRRIVERTMKAESLDDLFGQREVLTSDKLAGKTLNITDVEWDVYNSEDGPLPLARVTSTDVKSKEALVWITTSPNLTAFLARAQQLKALPFSAKIGETSTSRGFKTLFFERA